MRIVPEALGHWYPGVRAVGTWGSRLHAVLGAALGADVAGMPHTTVWGDIYVPNVVMAQSVAGVVVEEVLLLLDSSSQPAVLVTHRGQLQQHCLERGSGSYGKGCPSGCRG